MEIGTFDTFIADLNNDSSRRDSSQLRLSSVTAAIVDVIKLEGLEVNALSVYTKAVVTLEGALQKKHAEKDHFMDTAYTQNSLLELMRLILPLLENSSVSATSVPVGRAIRNLIDLIGSVDLACTELNSKDNTSCMASILSTAVKICSTIIKCASRSPKAFDEKAIRIFFRVTLRAFLDDESRSVFRVAREIVGDLLSMDNPKCHPAVLKEINAHIMFSLDSISEGNDPAQKCRELTGMLDLTRSNVRFLDPGLGRKLMMVLVSLIKRRSASSQATRDSSSLVPAINVLLSAVLKVLECEVDENGIKEYSGRVLATLLQVEPGLVVHGANEATCSAGRELIAQTILTGTRRLFVVDTSTAVILLPLSIGRLFSLANDQGKSGHDDPIAKKWLLELSRILRVNLPALKTSDSVSYAKCCEASFHVVSQFVGSQEQCVNQGAMVCLAEVVIQMETRHGTVEKTIEALISRREEASEGSLSELALEDAIRRIVQGLGIEEFWRLVHFPRLCFENPLTCSWLLKVMRQAGQATGTGCTSLSFFKDEIFPLIHELDSAELDGQVKPQRHNIVELWSLLQCFCVGPNDIAASLPKLGHTFVRAMKDNRYPHLLISIPTSIHVLAQNFYRKITDAAELSDQSAFGECRSDYETLKRFSETMLPTLFKLVDDLYCVNDTEKYPLEGGNGNIGQEMRSSQADALTDAIASLAKLASKELLQSRLFPRVVQRLLEASQTQEDLSDRMCSLLTLSHALYTSECLSEHSVLLLYRALRPLIGTDETNPKVQKRSYKLLSEFCKSKSFIGADGRLKDIVELLTSSTVSSQIAARSMRLRCIAMIIDSLMGSPELEQWVLSSLLGEILLCLKDSKNKTRDVASTLLVSVARDCDVVVLIRGIAAAAASETSHMRSAAVTALSKVVVDYGKSDRRLDNLMPSLIQTVLLLSPDPSREVSKSIIVFLRVAISVCPPEIIERFLPDILVSLLAYHKGKDRFRGKIKITMKKLLRIFGVDYLLPLVAASDNQIISFMKKLSKSENKPKKSRNKSIRQESVDELMASDEDDSDDETHLSGAGRSHGRQGKPGNNGYAPEADNNNRYNCQVRIRNDSDIGLEVKDLAGSLGQSFLESDGADDCFIFDQDGQIVVTNKSKDTNQKQEDSRSFRTSPMIKNRETSGKKLGEAYMSKKAEGDVKRKGQKFDPYAYVPLDGKSYTKKNRRHAVEQLDSVVRGKKRQKRLMQG